MEGGCGGLGAASGMAAVNTVYLTLLGQGCHVVGTESLYGPSRMILETEYPRFGVESTFVDTSDLQKLSDAMRDNTKLVYLESPANPTLKLCDLKGAAEIAHQHGALVCVDNTFATPYLQRPIELGATVVLHSATKYLGGHSDVVGGIAVTSDDEIAEHLGFVQNGVGAVPSPFDAYLVLRGLKTLAVRMDRHCHNARAVVDLLVGHDAVDQVLYPGLADHPGHEIAARQMSDFGGMVSFVLGDVHAARRVTERVELFTLAESLGAVESLIEVPALMTHLSTEGSDLEVPGGLVRLSVGIESTDDLVADLAAALA